MANNAIDLNGDGSSEAPNEGYQEVPAVDNSTAEAGQEAPASVNETPNSGSDPTRLSSLVEEDGESEAISPSFGNNPQPAGGIAGVVDADASKVKPDEGFGGGVGEQDPSGVGEVAPEEDNPVAPDEQVMQKKSRIVHVIVSLIIIFLVVGGAAAAAYWYSKSDSTFIKLPKLPFINEPQSSEEASAEIEEVEPEVPPPSTRPVDRTPIRSLPEEKDIQEVEEEESGTKGGLNTPEEKETPVVQDIAGWKKYVSSTWGYSFSYPGDWYLYPRNSGSIGEATMVTSSPLSSLNNDIRVHEVATGDLIIALGLLSENKQESETLIDYITNNASLYDLTSPEITRVGGRSYVRSTDSRGGVLHYHFSEGTKVYFVSIKPANFDSSSSDTIEKLISSISVSN